MTIDLTQLAWCATALVTAFVLRDLALKGLERYAAKPVMQRLSDHESAFRNFAEETREALRATTARLDALKAPQNHSALEQATGGRGLGRIAR